MFSKIFKASVTTLLLMAGPALADWNASPQSQGRSSVGATGQVSCAPGGSAGAVWGTSIYTSDSSVCGAAQHLGFIPQGGGGNVTYMMTGGLQAYQGSSQNGISSRDYGPWSLSFQITSVTPLAGGAVPQPTPISATMTLDQLGLANNVGARYQFICPRGAAASATVWGTDVYTSDSAICVAAQHRGLVGPGSSGIVNVMVLGGQQAYSGTTRNGVTSQAYPAWPRSFSFQ